jgi:ribosomal protein S6
MEVMRKYELVVVYDPSLTDAELDTEEGLVKARLEKFAAQEVVVERWGRRELAFMTKKRRSGIYVCYYYSLANVPGTDIGANTDISAVLKISDNVLLFQIHRIAETARKFKGRINPNPSSDDDYGVESRY